MGMYENLEKEALTIEQLAELDAINVDSAQQKLNRMRRSFPEIKKGKLILKKDGKKRMKTMYYIKKGDKQIRSSNNN